MGGVRCFTPNLQVRLAAFQKKPNDEQIIDPVTPLLKSTVLSKTGSEAGLSENNQRQRLGA
jgi:hypothetical protein